ncbi:PAS domain S-box protein [Deinococcus proteolyticus]|uniref:PAS domain S-box protein n=1 Tax=Deinococcus proteolyticus TaxID=55148 RepID=UPI0011D27BE8
MYEAMFQESPIGMALVSLEGTFLSVNSALCRILGYSSEELPRIGVDKTESGDEVSVFQVVR